jgi:multiple sugar transport system permease protein
VHRAAACRRGSPPLAFNLYPAVATRYYSFTKYDLIGQPEWSALNYKFMFTEDPQFWLAMRNTL